MTFYESILLNTIYIISPLILYYFFVAYNKNINNEENNLILELSLFTSLYFLIRLSNNDYKIILSINIPLLIAYINKRKSALLISIILIYYQYEVYKINIFLLIIDYITYYLIKNYKNFKIYFILLTLITFILNYYLIFDISVTIDLILNYILTNILILFILKKCKNVLKYHMTLKELECDNQVRTSLFKITHEIKNPLAVCKGYLDMYDGNIEKFKNYIPILKEEIDKTLILLQDFLSFTKIKIDKDIMDINLLLEENIYNLKNLLKEKNIKLITDIEEEIYINGDYNRLCQVIINIVKNSIESLENIKNKEINISSKKNKEIVIVTIRDNGCGMDEETLSNIATPFYTTKKNGTGLGTSMSFEIIKNHNGSINYYSKKNVGTKVVINLPIEKEL